MVGMIKHWSKIQNYGVEELENVGYIKQSYIHDVIHWGISCNQHRRDVEELAKTGTFKNK